MDLYLKNNTIHSRNTHKIETIFCTQFIHTNIHTEKREETTKQEERAKEGNKS